MECIWGDQTINLNETIAWKLGNRSLVLQRLKTEWIIWNNVSHIDSAATFDVIMGASAESLCRDDHHDDKLGLDKKQDHKKRVLKKNTEGEIQIQPRLSDRSFLVRPGSPLVVAPNETTQVYVSTPLWFNIQTKQKKLVLMDVPIDQPSDAWFGPSTLQGELCYAKFSDATTDPESIEWRCHRAVTQIVVHNIKKEELSIERINVPVPMLSIHQTNDNRLLTESLVVKCDVDDKTADIVIEKQPPQFFGKTFQLTKPRTPPSKRNLIKSLTSILG